LGHLKPCCVCRLRNNVGHSFTQGERREKEKRKTPDHTSVNSHGATTAWGEKNLWDKTAMVPYNKLLKRAEDRADGLAPTLGGPSSFRPLQARSPLKFKGENVRENTNTSVHVIHRFFWPLEERAKESPETVLKSGGYRNFLGR